MEESNFVKHKFKDICHYALLGIVIGDLLLVLGIFVGFQQNRFVIF